MYPQADLQRAGNWCEPDVREDTEDHSGVADRTDFSVDSAVPRVKGKHHDGDVLSWMAYYAIKSGGTANPFVLCG